MAPPRALQLARRALPLLAALVVLLSLPGSAQAQAVQDCQPGQYLDRTAPSADRELTWDFSIASDPERCLQVRAGQTVFFNGVSDNHPLGGSGGDTPNPISLHNNGLVTFSAVGTFGFQCLNHSSMKGAIKVVAAAAPAATPSPALAPWLIAALTLLLLASGAYLLPTRRQEV
jgi:hypothetical protein